MRYVCFSFGFHTTCEITFYVSASLNKKENDMEMQTLGALGDINV